MKSIKFLSIVSLLFVATFFSSCHKYEDGPALSLSTVKSRLSRNWTLTNMTNNGVAQDLLVVGQTVSFEKDGSYSLTASAQTPFGTFSLPAETGTWDFNNNKSAILLTKKGESTSNSFEILELRKKQLKVRYSESGNTIVNTYKSN